MNEEQTKLWGQFQSAYAKYEQLMRQGDNVSVDQWNAQADQVAFYRTQIQHDTQLIKHLFEESTTVGTQDGFRQRCLYDVLGRLWLSDVADDEQRILYSDALEQSSRLFLAPWESERDMYEQEEYVMDDEPARDLSRIGGWPTMLAEDDVEDVDLVFQIDFGGLFHGGADEPYATFLEEHHLPQNGLLQVYQRNVSQLEVRYLSEEQLRRRVPIKQHDQREVFAMTSRVLPHVTTESPALVIQQYAQFLREEAKRAALNGSYTNQLQVEMEQNSFAITFPVLSQVIGCQIVDEGVIKKLTPQLPIDATDRYVHLAQAVQANGRVTQLIIRASDLKQRQFSEVLALDDFDKYDKN